MMMHRLVDSKASPIFHHSLPSPLPQPPPPPPPAEPDEFAFRMCSATIPRQFVSGAGVGIDTARLTTACKNAPGGQSVSIAVSTSAIQLNACVVAFADAIRDLVQTEKISVVCFRDILETESNEFKALLERAQLSSDNNHGWSTTLANVYRAEGTKDSPNDISAVVYKNTEWKLVVQSVGGVGLPKKPTEPINTQQLVQLQNNRKRSAVIDVLNLNFSKFPSNKPTEKTIKIVDLGKTVEWLYGQHDEDPSIMNKTLGLMNRKMTKSTIGRGPYIRLIVGDLGGHFSHAKGPLSRPSPTVVGRAGRRPADGRQYSGGWKKVEGDDGRRDGHEKLLLDGQQRLDVPDGSQRDPRGCVR